MDLFLNWYYANIFLKTVNIHLETKFVYCIWTVGTTYRINYLILAVNKIRLNSHRSSVDVILLTLLINTLLYMNKNESFFKVEKPKMVNDKWMKNTVENHFFDYYLPRVQQLTLGKYLLVENFRKRTSKISNTCILKVSWNLFCSWGFQSLRDFFGLVDSAIYKLIKINKCIIPARS